MACSTRSCAGELANYMGRVIPRGSHARIVHQSRLPFRCVAHNWRIMNSPDRKPARARVRTRLSAPFGPPPLIDGENSAEYEELLARVSATVKPADILEEIWVRDIVDLVWEAWRLRRLKAALMAANAHRGLSAALDPLVEWSERKALVADWLAREPEAIKRVDQILESAGLTMDAVMAQTLSLKLNGIERIDRMIATAEGRRNAILRELDRHRTTWGQNLRRTVQEIEEAEIKVIEATPARKKSAA
jgi:hypothetical protein